MLTRANALSEQDRNKLRQRITELAPQILWLEADYVPLRLVASDGRQGLPLTFGQPGRPEEMDQAHGRGCSRNARQKKASSDLDPVRAGKTGRLSRWSWGAIVLEDPNRHRVDGNEWKAGLS